MSRVHPSGKRELTPYAKAGWVSMMSMPSSLIGFAIFRSLAHRLELPFTPVENVLVQTVAVAVGSMPLSAGFVGKSSSPPHTLHIFSIWLIIRSVKGVIPALERLLKPSEGGPIYLSTSKLIFWGLGVAFFGVFFAVPLRKQVIIREKLKFPSGTATALMYTVPPLIFWVAERLMLWENAGFRFFMEARRRETRR